MVRAALTIFAFTSFLNAAIGQKVKYKDLFILLNAKQYDQAEPFLRIYLKENDDNPNAYLFMGLIFQDKSIKNDVLKETEILVNNLDSAVINYEKAYQQIDEKELKRNDEYYQAYNRRDLRTGKFGVQLSDIQFDLEKRMQALKERKGLVTSLKEHFSSTSALYAKSQFLYKDVQLKYTQMKTLYLRSNDTTVLDLKRIVLTFDSCLSAFKKYQETSEKIGKTGYNQEISYRDIMDLSKDGTTPADFFANNLELWDYKKWGETALSNIDKEIIPLRDKLITYDIAINKLREKLRKDSVSVEPDINSLIDKSLYDQLHKYDPDPLPTGVFDMKIAELKYLSKFIEHSALKDSVDIRLHIKLAEDELRQVKALDSIAGKLESRDLTEDVKDYQHFVTNAYGTPTVLKSLIKTTKDFASRESQRKMAELEDYKESLKWIVTETDSIPLFTDVKFTSHYWPLILEEEKYTAGLYFADTTAVGYFRTITPSRKEELAINFPLDNSIYNLRTLPVVKALSSADDNGQVYYLLFYSIQKLVDKFPGTLVKIYRTDGLAWSSSLSFEMVPAEIGFQADNGEVGVKTSNPAGESLMVFIDRNGKRKETAN